MAQQVEHLIRNQGIPSSNLGSGSGKFADIVQQAERNLGMIEVVGSTPTVGFE